MKIAIPVAQGRLCAHFGHCEQFAVFEVEAGAVKGQTALTPPPHAPGVIPKFLNEQDVAVIIAGGMGQKAIQMFDEFGIKVIVGAADLPPREAVNQYLADTLRTGTNVCDH